MYNLAADLAMKIRNTDLRIREQLLYTRSTSSLIGSSADKPQEKN
jgi:hypothetical protein